MQILNGKGAIQYDSDAIATASLRKAITIYNIQGCAVIQYLQYLIPQPPVELKVDRMSITIFKLIQYLRNNPQEPGETFTILTALHLKY